MKRTIIFHARPLLGDRHRIGDSLRCTSYKFPHTSSDQNLFPSFRKVMTMISFCSLTCRRSARREAEPSSRYGHGLTARWSMCKQKKSKGTILKVKGAEGRSRVFCSAFSPVSSFGGDVGFSYGPHQTPRQAETTQNVYVLDTSRVHYLHCSTRLHARSLFRACMSHSTG